MTAFKLQEDLRTDLEELFKYDKFSTEAGEQIGINVYEQFVPMQLNQSDTDPVPYIIVRIDEGSIASGTSGQEVRILLIITIYDTDNSKDGHKTVLNIIHRIHEKYFKHPCLNKKHVFQMPFEWALQDEDTYPYYVGAINTIWKTAAIGKEDPYS